MSKKKRVPPKIQKTEQSRSSLVKPSSVNTEDNPFPDWNGKVPLPSNVDTESLFGAPSVVSSKPPSKILH